MRLVLYPLAPVGPVIRAAPERLICACGKDIWFWVPAAMSSGR